MNATRLLAQFDRVSEAPDAVPRLRRFILDLAVRGKLVEQSSAEPPADPSPRTLGSADVDLMQPKGWIVRNVGDVLNFRYGKPLPASSRKSFGRVTVFGSGGAVGYCEEALCEEAAIIVGRKGSAGALTLSDGPSWTTDVAYFVCPPPFFAIRYLLCALETLDLQRLAKGVKPGLSRSDAYALTIAVPPLAEQFRIVAKIDELMALCDRLEAAQVERENRRDGLTVASLQRLSEPANSDSFAEHAGFHLRNLPRMTSRPDQIPVMRQTILSLAVRGHLVLQDPNDESASELLNRIQAEKTRLANEAGTTKRPEVVPPIEDEDVRVKHPPGWCWERLAGVTRRIHYGFTAPANKSIEDVRLLRITDIQNNSVDWSTVPGCEISEREVDQYKLEKGDILIARTGGTIGKTFLVRQVPVTAVFASYLIRVQPSSELYAQYLKVFLESPMYWKQLQDGSRGTGQPNVNGQTLGKMILPLPPLAEQYRIVAKVDEMMALCDQLEAAQTEREDQRSRLLDAVLHEALSEGA